MSFHGKCCRNRGIHRWGFEIPIPTCGGLINPPRQKQHIVEALHEGQVVVLEDIGRFQISLQGKCYDGATLADPRLKEEIRKEFKLQRISSQWMK